MGTPEQNGRRQGDWHDRIRRLVHAACSAQYATLDREQGLLQTVVTMCETAPRFLEQDDETIALHIYLLDAGLASAPVLMAFASSSEDLDIGQKAHFWGLVARQDDEIWGIREHEPLPLYVLLVVYTWAGVPELAPILERLEPHLKVLRFAERGLVREKLDRDTRRDLALSGLYLARQDLTPKHIRMLLYPEIRARIQSRQREEILGELSQAEQERVKPKTQKKVSIDAYDDEFHSRLAEPSPVDFDEEAPFPSLSEMAERLDKEYPGLSPAERNALLDALDRDRRQGRDLTDCWGGKESKLYKGTIKSLERGLKRIKSGKAAAS